MSDTRHFTDPATGREYQQLPDGTSRWLPESTPQSPSKPWWRRRGVLVPIGTGVFGLIIGVASASGSGASTSATTATPAATTVTTTAAPTTVTATTTAPSAAATATTPPAVAAVLKAWTEAGPQPDKQHAAMAALKAQWPTLAEALEKATGVKAPAAAAAPAPAPGQPASATIPGDGTFIVGTDIKAGMYRSGTPDSGNCYWARKRDDSDSINSIIANNNSAGASVVTIRSSDKLFESSGCNDWTRVR